MGKDLTPGRPVGPTQPAHALGGGATPGGCVGASWLPFVSPLVSVYVMAI